MAQGAVAPRPVNGATRLTAEEIHEILECEKIVRFRDLILSGSHSRIKVPPHLNGKSASRDASTPITSTPQQNLSSSKAESKAITPGIHGEEINNVSHNKSSMVPRIAPNKSVGVVPMLAKAEINPILLEKSDDLIKAEIQLQRMRLERALREQVEQRRLSLKASAQTSESLPDFDISEVLSKALTIVHPSAASVAEQPVGDHVSASDSFDENTFYSSQHDTPEQSASSQELRNRGEVFAAGIPSTAARSINSLMIKDQYESSEVIMTDVPLSKESSSAEQELVHQPSPLLQQPILPASYLPTSPVVEMIATDTASQGRSNGAYDGDVPRAASGGFPQVQEATTGASLKRKFAESHLATSEEIFEPAIIRNVEDVPTLAPQPARVSPLVTARVPPVLSHSLIADEATPAQVAPSRKPSTVPSLDSSPKLNKTSQKKKNKKKKRASSGKQPGTSDVPNSPYIKPEPQSPAPFAAAPLPRPLQRQQIVRHGPELNYDEPRYDETRDKPQEQADFSHYKDHIDRTTHDRFDDDRGYESRDAETYGYRRVRRGVKHYNRIVSEESHRTPISPAVPARSYPSNAPQATRAASDATAEHQVQEDMRYSRDLPPRVMARMPADRDRSRSPIMRERRSPILMAPPPRLPPGRILVDYGQQYYTTPSMAVPSRRSVAPTSRPAEEDVIYERAPVRPVARNMADLYEEERLIYRRTSPPLAPSRRVVSHGNPDMDYRSYRQREYSSRATVIAPASEEFVRVRNNLQTKEADYVPEMPIGYAPLGYNARARSVRPETMRDDASREYFTKVQSVRPELSHNDYAPNERSGSLRGEGPPREYVTRLQSVRPELHHHEYAPNERSEILRGEGPAGEYVARLQSVRPEALNEAYNPAVARRESFRDGPPREYAARVQNVRPERVSQEYSSSVRREPRLDNTSQSVRAFSVRPSDAEVGRREYMPPADNIYEPPKRMVSRRIIDEAEYLEGVRDGTRDVYVDEVLRDVAYR